MNLVIDIGNTWCKVAVFEQNEIIYHDTLETISEEMLTELFANYAVERAIASSVRKEPELEKLLKKYKFFILSFGVPLPLSHKYATPETLGLDRLAAVVGAKNLYQVNNEPVLVIDMGTCITYDFLDATGTYLGGGISLGIEMRLKALNTFTGKLPLVKRAKGHINLIGDSTHSSILSGVYHGTKAELEGIIKGYERQFPNLNLVLTGGDMNRFDLAVKNRIFADEFLVLNGLNEILKYNEKV